MVDSVKNYGLAGVSSNVELGKQGAQIIGSDSSVISLMDKDGNLTVAAVADGSDATHMATKSQLDTIILPKLQYLDTTVTYNGGTQSIGTTGANTTVHSVVVEKSTNWSSANDTTEIIVGDAGDTDRLFAGFDPDSQVKSEPKHKYSSATAISAIVTQGGASSGNATVRVWYSGDLS